MRCLRWLCCFLLSATAVIVVLAILRERPTSDSGAKPGNTGNSAPRTVELPPFQPPEMRGEELSSRHFTQIIELIRPRNDEAHVEQVPWINFLWEARLKAAAEGKPIFIWAAGGPPGSC